MLLKRFWQSRGGNFAMMFGIALIPMILGAGVAVDYSRMLRAKGHLQAMADAAAIALAASRLDDQTVLEEKADAYVHANFNADILSSVTVQNVDHDGDNYEVAVSGQIPTTFMSIANINTLDIATSALAVRGVTGSVEVALVLDNTTSMGELDPSGAKKISALQAAANNLVTTLYKDEDAHVRVAVVPYADYVNVGTSHRHDGWVSVGADIITTSGPPANCGVPQTRTSTPCTDWASATRYVVHDGTVSEVSYDKCVAWGEPVTTTVDGPACTTKTTTETWFGCVGSRTLGTLRLSDASPNVPYPGRLERWQRCPVAITPLTGSANDVKDAIALMRAGNGYEANTYIPAGLVWGLNVLSPTVPFDEGKAYDAGNKDPRKVIVLMTDGENTMRFLSNGDHSNISCSVQPGGELVCDAAQTQQTHDDTLALCNNIKAQNIEIFSVAFAVDSPDAKSLLESCATDAQHYFDADDSVALDESFQQIADALTNVRLAR